MKLTIQKKILIGYSLVIVLLLIVIIWSFTSIYKLGNAGNQILTENYKSILAAENMVDAIERQDSGTLLIIMGYEDEGLIQFRENEEYFLESLGRAKDNITIPGEEDIIHAIDSTYTLYLAACFDVPTLYRNQKENSGQYYHENILPIFRSVRVACTDLRELNHQTMFDASDKASRLANNAMFSVTIMGVITVVLGILLSIIISSVIVRPIQRLVEATKDIGEGDYDVRLDETSSDELGILAGEYNTMIDKLKKYRDMNISQIVAEKRKSEAIIQNIDDGIIIINPDYKVTGINRTAANFLNIDSTEILDHHFLEIIKNEMLFAYVKEANETGETPNIESDRSVITFKGEDTDLHCQFSIIPIHDKSGPILSTVLLLRDITRLKELDRMKSEFVMAASHELRTPLASISMSIGLLEENVLKKLNENEKKLLAAANEEVERLKALVNNLLDLSKIEAGKMEMEFEKATIEFILNKAISVMISQTQEKGIQLTSDYNKNLPQVKVDSNKVTWVLTNLISNAIRYTESGGIIRLSAKHIGDHLHISVQDNGTGIPLEYQTKIFEKFVQVKDGKESKGSGLGLSICKEIIKAHGGTIWVESEPGRGSTFAFTLPII
ncbi:HAMP domain-containing protein [bacterium]|nr:HAMP domain-containing protein [bacterium]RQV98101.1 MAG: HAMP domain-containing protein [bacterium]